MAVRSSKAGGSKRRLGKGSDNRGKLEAARLGVRERQEALASEQGAIYNKAWRTWTCICGAKKTSAIRMINHQATCSQVPKAPSTLADKTDKPDYLRLEKLATETVKKFPGGLKELLGNLPIQDIHNAFDDIGIKFRIAVEPKVFTCRNCELVCDEPPYEIEGHSFCLRCFKKEPKKEDFPYFQCASCNLPYSGQEPNIFSNSPEKKYCLHCFNLIASSAPRPDIEEGGKRYNEGKLPMHLISPYAIELLAQGLRYGAGKYGDRNWERGLAFTKGVLASLERHIIELKKGNDVDEESGLSHAALLMTNSMFLAHMMHPEIAFEYKKWDDRPHYDKVALAT